MPRLLKNRIRLQVELKQIKHLPSPIDKLHDLRMEQLRTMETSLSQLIDSYQTTLTAIGSIVTKKIPTPDSDLLHHGEDDSQHKSNSIDGLSNVHDKDNHQKNITTISKLILEQEQVDTMVAAWSECLKEFQVAALHTTEYLKELELWKSQLLSGNLEISYKGIEWISSDKSKSSISSNGLSSSANLEHVKELENSKNKQNDTSSYESDLYDGRNSNVDEPSDSHSKKEKSKASDGSTLEEVLQGVSDVADKVESELQKNSSDFKNLQNEKGSSLETVVKVDSEQLDSVKKNSKPDSSSSASSSSSSLNNSSSSSKSYTEVHGENNKKSIAPVLVDANNNQYVMSKSNDINSHIEDIRLAKDMIVLLLCCLVGSFLTHLFSLPSFFGYLGVGMILGQLDILRSSIQIETLGSRLGITLIMFVLGLEFNLTKIRRVWKISIFGCLMSLILIIGFCFLMSKIIFLPKPASPKVEGDHVLVIGISLFLSSTIVALQCMSPAEQETKYGRAIVGILVAQDVLLGLLLSILPLLELSGVDFIYAIMKVVFRLAIFFCGSCLLCFPLKMIGWFVQRKSSRELILMFSLGVCLAFVIYGQYWGLSAEISAFTGGAILSASLSKQTEEATYHTVIPIRDFFSAIFFCSLGVHIFPDFVLHEIGLLFLLSFCTLWIKFCIGWVIMKIFCRCDHKVSVMIAAGLCQMSEFSFIFASKAKSNGLIVREVYYLILGTAAMSILASPLVWKLLRLIKLREDEEHFYESLPSPPSSSSSLLFLDGSTFNIHNNTNSNTNNGHGVGNSLGDGEESYPHYRGRVHSHTIMVMDSKKMEQDDYN